MRRTLSAFLTILFMVVLLKAFQPDNLVHIATGHYAGRMATVSSGDTIMIVSNSMDHEPPYASQIIFSRFIVGDSSAFTQLIDSGSGSPTAPTITFSAGELVVCYAFGTSRKIAISRDMGDSWELRNAGVTFELSPIAYKAPDYYNIFSLELPYPKWEEERFLSQPNSDEFIVPQHQTVREITLEGDPVPFTGLDKLDGPVRTNYDLYIKQEGGGENNGWPIFNDLVMVGGNVVSLSGDYPRDQIFRGSVIENSPQAQGFIANAGYSMYIGPSFYDPRYIVYVEVEGNWAFSWLGVVLPPQTQQSLAYRIYPSLELDDPMFVNTYSVADTIWYPLTNQFVGNREIFCRNELWIKGTFSGHQYWASSQKIRIVGDILLTGTPKGEDPSSNHTDFVNLVSDKGIQIGYGYWSPNDSLRYHVASATDDPIDIYATILSGSSSWAPSAFDFEYQHPHPSMPAVAWGDSLWEGIDLHRYRYPATEAEPWLSYLDYPWYNPLWPESQPYLERGTIRHWGSISQGYRGIMHRSLDDFENNPDGLWDIPNGLFGGSSDVSYQDDVLDISLQTINYPGAIGTGVGYKFQTKYDPRPTLSSMNNVTYSYGIDFHRLNSMDWNYWGPHYSPLEKRIFSKAYDGDYSFGLYAANNRLVKGRGDGYASAIYTNAIANAYITGIYLAPENDRAIITIHNRHSNQNTSVKRLDLQTNVFSDINLLYPESVGIMMTYCQRSDGREFLFYYSGNDELVVSEVIENNSYFIRSWNLSDFDVSPGAWEKSRIEVKELPDGGFGIVIGLVTEPQLEYSNSEIYFARLNSNLDSAQLETAPPAKLSMTAYPNPFRGEMRLDLKGDNLQNHHLELYNLRGQLIRRIPGNAIQTDGSFSYLLPAIDSRGLGLSSGIYLLKLYVDNKPKLVKKICVL